MDLGRSHSLIKSLSIFFRKSRIACILKQIFAFQLELCLCLIYFLLAGNTSLRILVTWVGWRRGDSRELNPRPSDLEYCPADDTSYVSNCGIVTMTKKSVSSVLKFLHNKRDPDSIANPNLDLGRSHSLIKSLSNYYFFLENQEFPVYLSKFLLFNMNCVFA